ncbi:hypothetical protein CMUS01_08276 [Colletotrichum musicola]|uniref:AB hydrolase-1 domain-containing protein n=1 Tax=Colletotrichum musicola TaxID=2175873 RepID=A0A8H6KCZ2_9PEZI|nr:hypothetical protein CMUS01_08276 [Colletotrichum musicola]
MSDATIQNYHIDNFRFHNGSPAAPVQLAFLDLNPTASKTALVLTCFRGRLQSTLAFNDGALKHYRVIVVALCGNGESSSPSNMANPPSYFDYQDCVRMQHALLTSHLGIEKLDVVVGFSMGGQCAYHWTLMHPNMVRNAVVICSSARTSRHNHQFLEGPKAALENSRDYEKQRGAPSASLAKPLAGLQAFGKAYSAWLTSPAWFEQKMYKSLGYESLSAWDHDFAGTNYHSWHPEDLLSLIRTWQKGDITAIFASEDLSLEQACARIRARVLLLPCDTDQYFRWEASAREARWIPDATLRVIRSEWGHLAGLGVNRADKEWMDARIDEFLNQEDHHDGP